ncbi:hypothetical protein PTKIN_Ptkin03bG0154400 [Pterospermum kingtungense]
MDLSHNHLTGNIPNWISRLSKLSYLFPSNHHLEGGIPLQLCKLAHLSLIDLSNNNLSVGYPSSSFSIEEPIELTRKNRSDSYKGRVLTYLSGIDLSCNKLSGEIPQEKNFQNINVLNLSHDCLTGPIPASVSELRQIESLDLS